MTIGLEQAGFESVPKVMEVSEEWTANLQLNRPAIKEYATSLEAWEAWAEEMREDPPDLLYGSPPCQGVSGASRASGADNPKNEWFVHFARMVATIQPRFAVAENIPRMLSIGRPIVNRADELLREAGYTMSHHHHDVQEFGVCQRRKRVMFIMERKGEELPIPAHPTLAPPTVMETIGDLESLERHEHWDQAVVYDEDAQNEYQAALRNPRGHTWNHDNLPLPDRFEHVPPGSQWTDMPREYMTEKERDRIDDNRLYNAMELFRLHPDRVARTLTGARNKIHPTQNRVLSARECSRLMAFPDTWRWAKKGDVQQFAAGVCPPVCKFYGEVFMNALAGTPMPVLEGRLW